jgi:hypothetical protein
MTYMDAKIAHAWVLVAAMLSAVVGCGGAASSSGKPRTPFYHGSLTSPYSRPLLPRYATEPGTLGRSGAPAPEDRTTASPRAPRAVMLDAAQRQLQAGQRCSGHGAKEVSRALQEAAPNVTWSPTDGLAALVRQAEQRRAYLVDGSPRAGDIVVFHNTHDANADQQPNDWLSSAGIVVEPGERFEAVLCTADNLRNVRAWPEGPAVREHRGEVVNSFLRVPSHSDPAGTAYLAGSLYAGHIDIDRLVD